MGYPFFSAMPYLMRAGRAGMTPGDDPGGLDSVAPRSTSMPPMSAFTDVSTDPGPGFHGTGPGFGPTVDADTRHRAVAAGISALGASLLDNSATGNWTKGLGQGIQGFQEAYGGTIDMAQKRQLAQQEAQRKDELDRREALAAADTHQSSVLHNKIDSGKYDQSVQEAADTEKAAAAKASAAKIMVANIQTLAQRSPQDAKLQAIAQTAAAYNLDDQSDLNKLVDLHGQMVGQAFHAQDAKQKTDDLIAGRTAEIKAHVLTDPADDMAIKKQMAGIAQGHLDVSRQRLTVAKEKGVAGTGGLTVAQVERQIQSRAAKIFDANMKRRNLNSNFRAKPLEIKQMQDQARQQAQQEVQGVADTILHYSNGKLYKPAPDPLTVDDEDGGQ